ncbi:bile acid:sodium symporter family protein [Roseimaritima sediminicola]|uniref:bile acid:sodium symporter family protein n=1 Tax=Roseimaritima sediminicola TaxID=2662066 RepID=UPI0013868F6C|nr:bile acid:sodium symporter [Roseimaritima sediminicola]
MLTRHWFLIALAAALSLGFAAAEPLSPLAGSEAFRYGVVAVVLLLMGLPLHPESMIRSLRKPVAWILAVVINVAVVPLLAWAASAGLSTELAGGLIVASVVPCTLASASVWTRKAGGDDSVAMMVTVVTNLACFVVAPLWLVMLLGQRVEIDLSDQVVKLGLLVALPLVLAQVLRRLGAAVWADGHRRSLALGAQVGILVMVVVGASQGGQRLAASDTGSGGGADWLWMVVAVVAVHLVAMVMGIASARLGGLGRPQQIAVGIAGSQKTLMVGLQLALDCGVSMLPMIVYHVGQLLLDTVIAQRWAAKTPNPKTAEFGQEEAVSEQG